MPANRAAIERHYTQPEDDEHGETCPECGGDGWEYCRDSTANNPLQCPCSFCDGTGRIDPADAAEALGERWADDQYEASIDREMGL